MKRKAEAGEQPGEKPAKQKKVDTDNKQFEGEFVIPEQISGTTKETREIISKFIIEHGGVVSSKNVKQIIIEKLKRDHGFFIGNKKMFNEFFKEKVFEEDSDDNTNSVSLNPSDNQIIEDVSLEADISKENPQSKDEVMKDEENKEEGNSEGSESDGDSEEEKIEKSEKNVLEKDDKNEEDEEKDAEKEEKSEEDEDEEDEEKAEDDETKLKDSSDEEEDDDEDENEKDDEENDEEDEEIDDSSSKTSKKKELDDGIVVPDFLNEKEGEIDEDDEKSNTIFSFFCFFCIFSHIKRFFTEKKLDEAKQKKKLEMEAKDKEEFKKHAEFLTHIYDPPKNNNQNKAKKENQGEDEDSSLSFLYSFSKPKNAPQIMNEKNNQNIGNEPNDFTRPLIIPKEEAAKLEQEKIFDDGFPNFFF